MRAHKFLVAASAIGLILIATYALWTSANPAEAAHRTIVQDGRLFRASDVLGSKRLANDDNVQYLFDERGDLLLIGKGLQHTSDSPHVSPSAEALAIMNDDGTHEDIITQRSIRDAMFERENNRVIYSTLEADVYEYDRNDRSSRKIATEAIHPQLSPDGTKLVYEKTPPSWRPGDYFEGTPGFAILDIKTSTERVVPNTNTLGDYAPLWTPDGNHILFFNEGIHIINTDGTGRTQLTNAGDGTEAYGISDDPLWSSDGRYFLYSADYKIMLVELDLAHNKVVSAGQIASGVAPQWVDEGKTISVLSPDAKAGAAALSVVNLNSSMFRGQRVAPRSVLPPLLSGPKMIAPDMIRSFTPGLDLPSIPSSPREIMLYLLQENVSQPSPVPREPRGSAR